MQGYHILNTCIFIITVVGTIFTTTAATNTTIIILNIIIIFININITHLIASHIPSCVSVRCYNGSNSNQSYLSATRTSLEMLNPILSNHTGKLRLWVALTSPLVSDTYVIYYVTERLNADNISHVCECRVVCSVFYSPGTQRNLTRMDPDMASSCLQLGATMMAMFKVVQVCRPWHTSNSILLMSAGHDAELPHPTSAKEMSSPALHLKSCSPWHMSISRTVPA